MSLERWFAERAFKKIGALHPFLSNAYQRILALEDKMTSSKELTKKLLIAEELVEALKIAVIAEDQASPMICDTCKTESVVSGSSKKSEVNNWTARCYRCDPTKESD